jgi:NAD(P) transhydrogenase subunit alpha
MNVYVVDERSIGEARIAITEDIARKLVGDGIDVVFGTDDNFDDVTKSDMVISINPPPSELTKHMKSGSVSIAIQKPHTNYENLSAFCRHNITSFALEMIPRTTRAQYMDVLSSQSNLAGYRAVIEAASLLNRAFPMMMTTAGTIQAAKVLVIGAGVAGLQAIATAKRLGAIVCAFDVRTSAKEQVGSLGAKFIEVDKDERVDGVYAQETSKNYQSKQEAKLREILPTQDVVITTAQMPLKKAPIIIRKGMIDVMKKDSVLIDLASETGGNCELTEHGKTVVHNGICIISFENILNNIHHDASRLFAKNVYAFIKLLVEKLKETPNILESTDEIIKGTLLTHGGKMVKEIQNAVCI